MIKTVSRSLRSSLSTRRYLSFRDISPGLDQVFATTYKRRSLPPLSRSIVLFYLSREYTQRFDSSKRLGGKDLLWLHPVHRARPASVSARIVSRETFYRAVPVRRADEPSRPRLSSAIPFAHGRCSASPRASLYKRVYINAESFRVVRHHNGHTTVCAPTTILVTRGIVTRHAKCDTDYSGQPRYLSARTCSRSDYPCFRYA